MKIVLRLDRNWPISPNISTITKPVFTNVSALIDVHMRIIQEALLLQRDCARHLSVKSCNYKTSHLKTLSCGIICVILRLAVLIQYRNVTDTHTECMQTDRHTTTAYTALSIASRGKNRPYCAAHQL